MTTKVTDDMLAADYVQVGEVQGVPSGGTGRSSVTAGNYLRGAGASPMEERTPAQVRSDISAQQSSAVLDALVGMAASRFMARASGDPSPTAKTLTDFALTLLDDANAAAMLTTLGIVPGLHTPTLTSVANVSASTARQGQYLRVSNVVLWAQALDVTPTANTTLTRIGISLPVASDFANDWNLAGVCVVGQSPSQYGNVLADATNNRAELAFISTGTGSSRVFFISGYQVL